MPTRNTGVLTQVIQALNGLLTHEADALPRLEEHYKDQLLIVAGDVQTVDEQAQTLRLAITTYEAGQVLDYIQEQNLAVITIETTEEVINSLFPDRFIEP